jgi:hypothetical protein
VVAEEDNSVELDPGVDPGEGSRGVVVEAAGLEVSVLNAISDNDKAPGTNTAPKLEVVRVSVAAPGHVQGRRAPRHADAYREDQAEGSTDAVCVETAAVRGRAEHHTQILECIVLFIWARDVGETSRR